MKLGYENDAIDGTSNFRNKVYDQRRLSDGTLLLLIHCYTDIIRGSYLLILVEFEKLILYF